MYKNIQIVKLVSLLAIAISTSIAFDDSRELSRIDARRVAMQVAMQITKK
jgi:hypothetical protein